MSHLRLALLPTCVLLMTMFCAAQLQDKASPTPLDAARALSPIVQEHLPEEYIWTEGDATALRSDRAAFPWARQELRVEPHVFRKRFHLDQVPSVATIYLAGPREASIFLNGQRLTRFSSNIDAPIGLHVFHADTNKLLKEGENTIVVAAVRGRGIVSADASRTTAQLAYGEVLAVKIVAASPNHQGRELLISDKTWRSQIVPDANLVDQIPNWASPSFDDKIWHFVSSLGPIEENVDLRQWSADAGMYAWPGYQGITTPLGVYTLSPVALTHVFTGQANFIHLNSLLSHTGTPPFAIEIPAVASSPPDAWSPSVLLDFGREIAGRVVLSSESDRDAVVSVAYGESELEALATGDTPGQRGGNYLGTNLLEVPAHGEARGPKSAFRYVQLRFLRGGPHMVFSRIQAEAIAYPVTYAGSFQSSDPLLNRIWETGAYTVHLCMQDALWDAPKRDRGRWAGDIDVEGRVISEVFGDKTLIEQTLAALARDVGPSGVNGIPNYSALWLTSLASLYAHSGDLKFLDSQHDAIRRVVSSMDSSLDPAGVFTNPDHHWLFVDWSPGLYGMTPQAVLGTNLQYIRGYRAAASLYTLLGDSAAVAHARTAAERLEAGQSSLPAAGISANHNWQLAALAVVLRRGALESQPQDEWTRTLSQVKQDSPDDPVISPYFNLSVLDAMADLGHPREALDWLRTYWGGMLQEGATSFWESYDLRWPKDTPHLSLQADGTSGFFVSLAHGWSAGPTAWLAENVLGVRDPEQGYRRLTIAPHLLGLAWAKGTVATPHGAISVALRRVDDHTQINLDLPVGVEEAVLSLEPTRANAPVLLDGHVVAPTKARSLLKLGAGKHTLSYIPLTP